MTSYFQPVSPEEITSMITEYDKQIRQPRTIQLKARFPDRAAHIEETQSAWISWKELEKLRNANMDTKGNTVNGIRIYFGIHVLSTDPDPKMDFLGKQNVILVATIDAANPAEPTVQNSVDQLEPGQVSEIGYAGKGLDLIPLCPPVC